jgi:hypothetical protein
MKLSIVGLLLAAPLAAQYHTLTHPLGSGPAVVGAFGGGALGFPSLTRPLGGVAVPGAAKHASAAPSTGLRYAGPVYYVPDAYGTSYFPDTSQYTLDYSSGPVPAPNPQQPVVINQYFVTKGSDIPGQPMAEATGQPEPAPAVNPGDPLGPTENYYLIAYKDHSIYSALAYWVEGGTLHYVTTENTHNQASLSLIDVDRTYKLNADRSVPFAIPAGLAGDAPASVPGK